MRKSNGKANDLHLSQNVQLDVDVCHCYKEGMEKISKTKQTNKQIVIPNYYAV